MKRLLSHEMMNKLWDVDEEKRLLAEGMLKDATDTTERNESYRQTLINELKAGEHKDIVGELVKQMGGKVSKTHKSNFAKAVLWLECEPQRRPFLFLTVPQLQVSTLYSASRYYCIHQLKCCFHVSIECRPSIERALVLRCPPS